jgi:hypothetical protein
MMRCGKQQENKSKGQYHTKQASFSREQIPLPSASSPQMSVQRPSRPTEQEKSDVATRRGLPAEDQKNVVCRGARSIGAAHSLRILLCSCAITTLSGQQWDAAMPFEGLAQGNWALTVTGSFNAVSTYKCQFAPTISTQSPITSNAFAPTGSSVVCTTPEWTYAAQATRLKVLDAATNIPIPGPGGTAESITYVAFHPEPSAFSLIAPLCHFLLHLFVMRLLTTDIFLSHPMRTVCFRFYSLKDVIRCADGVLV